MNNWLTKYSVFIDDKFNNVIGYLIPLNSAQISREMLRLASKYGCEYESIRMRRLYE
jgi:hypothetical protein